MALGRANTFSRFVMCGGISQYNAETKSGPSVSSRYSTLSRWSGCVD
jgi:NADPH-dependent curcumin reductase CurA